MTKILAVVAPSSNNFYVILLFDHNILLFQCMLLW